MSKIAFKCIKTFAAEKEVYGIDFYKDKTYYGIPDGIGGYYMDSTENGTSVEMSVEEIDKHFKIA